MSETLQNLTVHSASTAPTSQDLLALLVVSFVFCQHCNSTRRYCTWHGPTGPLLLERGRMTKFPPASKKRWGFRIAELHSRAKGSAEAHKLATWPEISSHYQSRCASLAGRGALFLRCYKSDFRIGPPFCLASAHLTLEDHRDQSPWAGGGREANSVATKRQKRGVTSSANGTEQMEAGRLACLARRRRRRQQCFVRRRVVGECDDCCDGYG